MAWTSLLAHLVWALAPDHRRWSSSCRPLVCWCVRRPDLLVSLGRPAGCQPSFSTLRVTRGALARTRTVTMLGAHGAGSHAAPCGSLLVSSRCTHRTVRVCLPLTATDCLPPVRGCTRCAAPGARSGFVFTTSVCVLNRSPRLRLSPRRSDCCTRSCCGHPRAM
jgi:hypothetical protein